MTPEAYWTIRAKAASDLVDDVLRLARVTVKESEAVEGTEPWTSIRREVEHLLRQRTSGWIDQADLRTELVYSPGAVVLQVHVPADEHDEVGDLLGRLARAKWQAVDYNLRGHWRPAQDVLSDWIEYRNSQA